MKDGLGIKIAKYLVGALLVWMSIPSTGPVQAAALTDQEQYWLTYLREEEKLARDVYLELYDLWKVPIFKNIPKSEQRHMNAIKPLLDRYGIPDPATGHERGEFVDPKLKALYDKLVGQGKVSRTEAFKVGVSIEETDIADLKAGMASTTRKDIRNVYSHLLQASHNHLKAFRSHLAKKPGAQPDPKGGRN
jgi:hypothetical protein